MKKYIIIYIVGFLISWPLMAGMENAFCKAEYSKYSDARRRRQHLGFSIAWGFIASTLWPTTVPAFFFYTGFGVDGWSLTTDPKPVSEEAK